MAVSISIEMSSTYTLVQSRGSILKNATWAVVLLAATITKPNATNTIHMIATFRPLHHMAARGAGLPLLFFGQFGQSDIALAQAPVLFILACHTESLLTEGAFGFVSLHAYFWNKGVAVQIWAVYGMR